MIEPLDRVRGRAAAFPIVAAAAAFALMLGSLLQRAQSLALPAYDTAFFEQVVWNLGHGRGFVSGYSEGSFLGLHFSPLLVLPAWLEMAWPSATVLSVIQAAALATAAPAAYLLLKALLEPRQGASIAAAALAGPLPFWVALQEGARAGFHPEALALPLVLMAGWAGVRGRSFLCLGAALVALGAKEDQAYAVAVIGLLVLFHGSSRWLGGFLVAGAVVWALVVEAAVMPLLRAGVPTDLDSYYSWLRHPALEQVAGALSNRPGWLAFGGMIAAMAALPLLRPGWLALALPVLVGNLLSAHQPQPELRLQYGLPLVVPILVAGGLGARMLLDRFRRPSLLPLLGLPALVLGLVLGPLLLGPQAASGPAVQARLAACASALPAAAPVAADDDTAAFLAARPVERPLTRARASDWLVVDRGGFSPSYVDARGRAKLLAGVPSQGRRLACDDGRFQLWAPAGQP